MNSQRLLVFVDCQNGHVLRVIPFSLFFFTTSKLRSSFVFLSFFFLSFFRSESIRVTTLLVLRCFFFLFSFSLFVPTKESCHYWVELHIQTLSIEKKRILIYLLLLCYYRYTIETSKFQSICRHQLTPNNFPTYAV
jgi:hypothetical protein